MATSVIKTNSIVALAVPASASIRNDRDICLQKERVASFGLATHLIGLA